MRKYLFSLLLLAPCAFAQVEHGPVVYQSYQPTGSCVLPNTLVVNNGSVGTGTYQCVAGTWTLVGPSNGATVYPGVGIGNSTGTAWATSYSSTNTIPANFLASIPYAQLTGTVPTWNQSTTGNAATATAFFAVPTQCTGGQFATGVAASGNANCGTPSGSGTVTSVGVTTANGVSATGGPITGSGSFTFSLGAITPISTNGVTAATMAFVDPTSSIQTQLNGKQANLSLAPGTYINGDLCSYNSTGTLLNCNTAPSGTGTVTSVSVTTANGVSGTVANATTTPAITLTLGAINPTSIGQTTPGPGSFTSITIPGDGVHAGQVSIYPNTTVPTLTTGQFSWLGPNAASMSQWAIQMQAAYPATAGIAHIGAGVSGGGGYVSQFGVSPVSLTADVSGALPHTNIAATAVTPGSYTNANITVAADGSITAASNGSGGSGGSLTGSGLTTGDVYYVNSSGVLTLAEANASTTLPAVCVASSTTLCVYSGTITTGSWTAGGVLYVSDATAGALTQTAPSTSGHFVQIVGVATSTTAILIMPSLNVAGIL